MNKGRTTVPELIMSDDTTEISFEDLRLPEQCSASATTPAEQHVRFVLTMIVRNEERTLPRCLDACASLIDAAVICDTGSDDTTPEVVRNFLSKVPGALCRQEWKNFGHNRTLSARAANEFISRAGWRPERTFLLFLDADMVLLSRDGFDKQNLDRKGYLVNQSSGATIYANVRLGRADCRWTSVGVTHEYWSSHHDDRMIHESQCPMLSTLIIDDRNDGGFKATKFTRDAQLLEEGIRNEPQNVRYKFYLAQTYRDIASTQCTDNAERRNDFNRRSLALYRERVAAGGWAEEVYFSMFQIGVLLERLEQPNDAILAYLEAFDFRPSRCEAIAAAASLARHRGKNSMAVLFAKQALTVAPSSDVLFIDREAWRLQPLYTISICGFYTPDKEIGLSSLERLRCDPNVAPNRFGDNATFNLFFYAKPLPSLLQTNVPIFNVVVPSTLHRTEQSGSDRPDIVRRMSPANPSMAIHQGKLLLNVRLVNYNIRPPLCYEFPFEQDAGRVLTRNVLGSIDPDTLQWSSETATEIDDYSAATYATGVERIQGCEDMRLVSFRGRLWCTFTSCEAVPGQVRIVLGRFDEQLSRLERMLVLHGEGIGTVEKNWLPYVVDDELRVLYSTDPLRVYRVDVETGLCTLLVRTPCELRFGFARGSSSPVWLRERESWLYVTHEVVPRDGGRVYLHRFVEVDNNMKMKARTHAFYFEDRQVEFVCGAVRNNNDLLISYGVWDRKARIVRVPLHKVFDALKPVDEF